MPASALSRAAARVVESGADRTSLDDRTWARLAALPDPARRGGGSTRWPAPGRGGVVRVDRGRPRPADGIVSGSSGPARRTPTPRPAVGSDGRAVPGAGREDDPHPAGPARPRALSGPCWAGDPNGYARTEPRPGRSATTGPDDGDWRRKRWPASGSRPSRWMGRPPAEHGAPDGTGSTCSASSSTEGTCWTTLRSTSNTMRPATSPNSSPPSTCTRSP